jgi:outer membrane cobalamin receptor
VLLALWMRSAPVAAQTTATLVGRVFDQNAAALPGAQVELTNPITGFRTTAVTSEDATFRVTNVPLQAYRLTVTFPGFEPHARDVDLRTSVPVTLDVTLTLAAQRDTVVVTGGAMGALVDPTLTGTRTAVSQRIIERMPAATGSRGLESVLVSFPGFAQNANGAIHPRGAHNQMTYVVDGLPISDQLTGAFANALDTSMVQTVETMTGNIPAEFGAKISGVAIVTTRSGLGTDRPVIGDVSVRAGGFRTAQTATQIGGQRGRVGYFATVTAMRTDRFLDQVSLDNLHNAGHFARGFGRVDGRLGNADLLRGYVMAGRSSFELANLRSQEANGQDQQQRLADWSTWLSHLKTLGSAATLESTAAFRTTSARMLASAGDTPVTAAQDRSLDTVTLATRYTHVAGRHSIRAGADLQRFPVREWFTLGITHAAFNDPTSPTFNAALLPHDLTRGGIPFVFEDERTGTMASAFVQDTIRWDRLTTTVGLRFDDYRFIVRGHQLQPRVGVAWSFPESDTVVRASYNRNYQTPPNENLLLSSSEVASRLAPQSVRDALDGTYAPIQPERQDVVEVGVQQALFGRLSLDMSAYRKQSRDQQDNNNFFDTGIIFPTTLKEIDAKGLEARLTVPPVRGVSGSLSVTSSRATSTPPFTGGLFLGQDAVDLLSTGPFLIDHDQALSLHGTINYTTGRGVWLGGVVRYDSGLVANPSDPIEVAADPDFADLLPYVDLDADVPRVRPRTIVDAIIGYDGQRNGRRAWSVRLQLNNLTNRTALYNFQSVFVGTRLVQPRTTNVEFRYFW